MLFRALVKAPVVRSLIAFRAGFRPSQETMPCHSFVPDLVAMLMVPPALWPMSASTAFFWTLVSCTASAFGTQAAL